MKTRSGFVSNSSSSSFIVKNAKITDDGKIIINNPFLLIRNRDEYKKIIVEEWGYDEVEEAEYIKKKLDVYSNSEYPLLFGDAEYGSEEQIEKMFGNIEWND